MTKPPAVWPILLPLVLFTQTPLIHAEEGSDYVINALARQREARELQEKRDREWKVHDGTTQAEKDAYAADAAQARWEDRQQAQFAAENAAYYERVRRQREAADWQAYRERVNFRCPIDRPPTFTSQAGEFAYWKGLCDRDPYAAFMLGQCHATGRGTVVDHRAAIDAYVKSNRQWPEVQCNLGYMLLQPDIEAPDPVGGIALLSQAAEGGYIDAMFTLAACYHRGTGVARDPARTFMWLYDCFIYPTTDGDPYLEPSYRMLGEEREHLAAILDAVMDEMQHQVVHPWGAYERKEVFRFLAAAAGATNDGELWYQYALHFPPDGENAAFEVPLALGKAAEHGHSKALHRLLATPADVNEVYEPAPKAREIIDLVVFAPARGKIIAWLTALPPDAASATALARIYAGDLGGTADPANAGTWAMKAAALGDYRPCLALSRAYGDGGNGLPRDQTESAAWSARIPEAVWNTFHHAQILGDPRDQALVGRLTKAFGIHWKFTLDGESVIVDSLAPFDHPAADAPAMAELFEQGFAVEAQDPRAALEAYATAVCGGNLPALIRIALLSREKPQAMPGRLWDARWASTVTKVLHQLADAGDADAAMALADEIAHFARWCGAG